MNRCPGPRIPFFNDLGIGIRKTPEHMIEKIKRGDRFDILDLEDMSVGKKTTKEIVSVLGNSKITMKIGEGMGANAEGFRGIHVIVKDTKDLSRNKFKCHLKAMIGQTYELMATTDGNVPRGEMTKFEIVGRTHGCCRSRMTVNDQTLDIIAIISSTLSSEDKVKLIKERYPDFYATVKLKELCQKNKNEKIS